MPKEYIILILIVGTLIFTGTFQSYHVEGTRTYFGKETFANIDDALAFQKNVAEEATAIDADIRKCDLTSQSPPTVSFVVIVPAVETPWLGDIPTQFQYGELKYSQQYAKISIIGFNIFCELL